jgi:hypothetical protein
MSTNAEPHGAAEFIHEIHLTAPDEWRALSAVTTVCAAERAHILSMQAKRFPKGDWAGVLRIAGVAPEAARGLADRLAQSRDVSSAQVEHVLWRARG